MNDKLKYSLLGLLIGIVLTWGVTATVLSINTEGTTDLNSRSQTQNSLDAHFIEQMIPHHEDAITMAKLAQEKAQRPEVKKMANEIINAQSSEIDEMKTSYKDWFGRELPAGDQVMQHHGMGSNASGMHMGMTGTAADVTSLKNAADFDTAFVEHMIPHHQMAVMMASMLKQGTTRPEMSKLADDIITAQTDEIEQMRMWLQEWK